MISKTFQVCFTLVEWDADFAFVLWFVSYEREPMEASSVETVARDCG